MSSPASPASPISASCSIRRSATLPITVDLRNASLEEALNTVAGVTRTFFRVTAQNTVVVVPDTEAKRREYEEEVVRTFYLSNADLKETMDLLRLVLDARRISVTTATNALTIKDTPERMAAAARVAHGDRQGASGSHHRRRAARGRSHEAARLRPADRVARAIRRSASTDRSASTRRIRRSRFRRCAISPQSDVLLANLPSLYYRLLKIRREHADAGESAAPHLGRHDGSGALRRAGAGPDDDVRADRDRRHAAAADHRVRLPEHRREHRHHAADPSRRRCDAGAEGCGDRVCPEADSAACRPSATARSTR